MTGAVSYACKIRQYARYRKVFSSLRDVNAYRLVRDHPERCEGLVALRLRCLNGGALSVRPGTMDPITLWDAFFHAYHLPSFPLIEPQVILDLGANAGYTAASFAAHYPTAKVIALELDADNAAICTRNLTQFRDRCHVVHAGVWIERGIVSYDGGNVHDYSIGSRDASKTAPAITVDDLLRRFHLTTVDYMKMDIEGAEARILDPSAAWLAHVKSLSIEVHPPATMQGCRTALLAAGFSVTYNVEHARGLIARRNV